MTALKLAQDAIRQLEIWEQNDHLDKGAYEGLEYVPSDTLIELQTRLVALTGTGR